MDLLFFSPHATLASIMPKPSKLALAPLPASDETPGQRLARLRRERGKLRRNADMILRFSTALDVSTDDLLQPSSGPKPARKTSRRVLQRLERIEALPAHVQTTVPKSLDLIVKSVAPAKRQQVTR